MRLPIGIQDFAKLREGGFAYVDKTEDIYNVLSGSGYNFLSRPRRFGKSLLLSTIRELYGNRPDLFEGLWIADHWDFPAMERPVIWLKFASADYAHAGLPAALDQLLAEVARQYGVVLRGGSYKIRFKNLIQDLASDRRVVVLIDEYDRPVVDYLGEPDRMAVNRSALKNFFSVLKDADPYLEGVFITGVSAFSKVSIFSDLNNLRNLTLNRVAWTLTGITHAELLANFGDLLKGVDLERVRRWYNGYSWGSEDRVYNPFSLLSFLESGQYQNYWFATGTPTFLVEEMRRQAYYDVRRVEVAESTLTSFDTDKLNPVSVLFQAGYLTVKDYLPEARLYVLDYPNNEVRESLQQQLLNLYTGEAAGQEPAARIFRLAKAIGRNDIPTVVDIFNATFAMLPYEMWQRDDEHFFHAIVHLTFSLLGLHVQSEVHTARGRCDAVVVTDDYVHVFEFKRDRPAGEALAQIEERGYLDAYADGERERVAVGVGSDSGRRQVSEWVMF